MKMVAISKREKKKFSFSENNRKIGAKNGKG